MPDARAANPLLDVHRQAEAELQGYGDVEIVSTFGEPQAEYAAIRKSVGLMDWPQRGILELTGKDRLPFLNNLLSNETWSKETRQPLPAGRWIYSYLLNLRGRIVVDMNVLELGDRTLLEVDRRLVRPLRGLLDAYLFAEQVKMADRSDDLHEIALHGPDAGELLQENSSDGRNLPKPQCCGTLRIIGHDAVVWRDDVTSTPGIYLVVPTSAARAIWMHLVTAHGQQDQLGKRRLRPVGWAAFNATRIEAGRPIFGIDFEGAPVATAMPGKQQRESAETSESPLGVLPAETGQMDRAVSLTKCYLGQEIVARMHARHQVARKIVGIRMESDALPIAGTEILDENSNPVGIVTSSTNSPVLSNTAICLGTVKRPLFEIGTELRIPAEGSMRKGIVVKTPFL